MPNASAKVTQGQLDRYRVEEVLWETSNVDRQYGEEQITLSKNINAYDYIVLLFIHFVSSGDIYTAILKPTTLNGVAKGLMYYFSENNRSISGYTYGRSVRLHGNLMDLGKGYADTSEDPKRFCPIKVIGIKYNSSGGGALSKHK